MVTTPASLDADADAIAEEAIALVEQWLARAEQTESRSQRLTMDRLEGVVASRASVQFVMQFVDRVIRPDDNRVAASQLRSVVDERELPGFLSVVDRTLLRAGARLAPLVPDIVLPLARWRMRSIVGHLVSPAEPAKLAAHLATKRQGGYQLNVNLLGEAVLGEHEAQRRLDELLAVVDQPDVDYVSVKISAVASQLNHWAHADSLERVSDRLRLLVRHALAASPPTFINFDMEEYHDLSLTLAAFVGVLSEPELWSADAGIVLQAYLPDAFPALQELVAWANRRHNDGGGQIKIRLVKGANLAMERVDAAVHGWEQAPFATKHQTDANYKRCLDWLLTPEHLTGVRLGLASHNLFDVAWTHLLAQSRGVSYRVQFEMLEGMAPAQAAAVAEATNPSAAGGMLLYTPAVRAENFDVAISYLFRRLEENASDDNFLRHLFDMTPGSVSFREQAERFRTALAHRHAIADGPSRTQNRLLPAQPAYRIGQPFRNEPETDPSLAPNRTWIDRILASEPGGVRRPITVTIAEIDHHLERARSGAATMSGLTRDERQRLLHRVGDALADRRGDLIAAMMHEAGKTLAEADVEVAEAIDFARWYGDRSLELERPGHRFEPFGVVAVVPPWNFPVAIPAGGVLAALAAGNSVLLKPAPETPRCAELVAEACWAAGVGPEALQFVRTPDDHIGRHLVTSVDAVILTGAAETADLFRSWKPDLRLFAETSGKNAMIITPNADLDLAVADLVRSAFGHSGQKCSAASLAILVGDVATSERFRRQLQDAVRSIEVGPSTRIETTMGPIVGAISDRLHRGLTQLEDGESWLVEPRLLDAEAELWSPGVRRGVTPGSWFHRTECFGPVLGLMAADDLDEAIAMQNSSLFGLTGGLHSLDPNEIEHWTRQVEVGNGYVNRVITGAIVARQPFGGWKRSSVGPGAKAGGPNYVMQLGSWHPTPEPASGGDDFAAAWTEHFSIDHDPIALFCEANIFRYRPLDRVGLRIGPGARPQSIDLVRRAARQCGVTLIESSHGDESQLDFAHRLESLGLQRVRILGETIGPELQRTANHLQLHLADAAATGDGRMELQHYVREQAISRTLHRFGNLVSVTAARPGLQSGEQSAAHR